MGDYYIEDLFYDICDNDDVHDLDGSIMERSLVFIIASNHSSYFQYVNDIPEHLPDNVLPLTKVLRNHYELVYAFDVDGVGSYANRGWYCCKKFSGDIKHAFVAYPGEDVFSRDFEMLLEIMEL